MKRELMLIWKNPQTRSRFKIGDLSYDEKYTFKYVNPELDDALDSGFEFFPGFEDVNKVYESKELFANIETRLPSPARADYLSILNSYNLEIDSSKFDILKATKGRLITDNYEFVPVFDKNKIESDVAGTRHCDDIKKYNDLICINDKLLLELDSDNEYDKNAIKVILKKNGETYHLGYVPRYYTAELTELLKNNVQYSAMVQSLNFESKITDENITVYVKLIFS